MNILGIETSCDETGVAVYCSNRGIVAEALASQTALHARYGGVVPELASRDHIAKLAPMVADVLDAAGREQDELDAVAYTAGPGLIGALMVGGAYAVALAYGLGIPAIPVHHMEGHLLAVMLEAESPQFPFLALLVSGGHTLLVDARRIGEYDIVGATLDDAAGEAFDKVARLLSLPYPGGPALAALAEDGDPEAYAFPRPLANKGLDLSFSGLKTAVRLAVEEAQSEAGPGGPSARVRADVAAAFQAAVVDCLVGKCAAALAATGRDRLVIAGGVGANAQLRRALRELGSRQGIDMHFPRPALCTDNGAMIAFAGACRLASARLGPAPVLARPRWPLNELSPPQ